jgi:protein-S-isoprenylcysteine O-methyltransferase Ste14
MILKARREEELLREGYGQIYINYCRRTGRFFPLLRHMKWINSTGLFGR